MSFPVTLLHFVREFVKNPRHTGAICPSSRHLAAQMAALLPNGQGKIIELGPGSGPMTAAMLQQGVAPDDLILIERTQSFAEHLRRRFPAVRVIHGDACHLQQLLDTTHEPIRAIVSSLPLRSMPAQTVAQISAQIRALAHPGTRFIQFTYHLHDHRLPIDAPFRSREWRIVWRNFPPARVDAFEYHPAAG
ncbi:class I SAM-dependent methyltransferase [Halothiobacillus sp. DCM-1]|uniref:class I SAM-dependent methyltransferase n=1 Tax=Halothiobacillus sp. DCM-1 TaxID=3112558 RepID=UPI0032511E96